MKKFEILILAAILITAFLIRLYKINRPIADWHSWRQADTAAVARNFIKEGFNPFIPRYDDMSSQTNGLDNPQRYRFVEFPVYNAMIAAVWSQTGINETYARLVTVFITLGSILLLYFLVKHFSDAVTAALSAFFFAAIPYNIFYSSTILPGPLMVFGILGLYLSFAKWLENDKQWLLLAVAILFANLAILSWPIAIFFLIPIVYLAFEKYGLAMFRKLNLWIFVALTLLPFVVWRIWMTQFPEGIPNWQFLLNESNIRFKGAFFRWLIAERMDKLILTVGGFVLFILGILKKPIKKEKLFYFSWLLAVAVYFTVFASGNIRHDYYQVPFIPIAVIFMSIGTKTLFNLPSQSFNRFFGPLAAIVLIILIFAFGAFEIRGYYWINKPQIISAGRAVDRLLPTDATVIAPYNGDAAFLYQTKRRGFPYIIYPLPEMINRLGAQYYVSVNFDEQTNQVMNEYTILEKTDKYVIVDLQKKK